MDSLRKFLLHTAVLLTALGWLKVTAAQVQRSPDPQAERVQPFDWNEQRTSVADVMLADAVEFRHGEPGMTPIEADVYLNLLDGIERQYQQLWRLPAGDPTATWEQAFYKFAEVRRMAWKNGKLKLTGPPTAAPVVSDLADPFRDANAPIFPLQPAREPEPPAESDDRYSLLADIRRHPSEYVGRPVVMFGLFEPAEPVDLRTGFSGTAGMLTRPARLLRGVLKSLDGTQQLAIVDTKSLKSPGSTARGLETWPATAASLPVLVKGWVVKQWDTRPLIYCESLRQMSVEPHTELIRQETVPERRILPEETWLYYETLLQMRIADADAQQRQADEFLIRRIDSLIVEVGTKAAADLAALNPEKAATPEQQASLQNERVRIQRLVTARLARYRRCRRDPETFQTYVDLFTNSDAWQGQLVTLKGHVRHVVSYAGDSTMFDGQPLHELWLFTDDSQNNPAVIVTPDLPPGFPVNAEVIDRVSVTGCFFKRYVYGSQDNRRIAPLLLAGRIRWEPTLDQIRTLVSSGDLSAGSPLAQQALQQQTESFSGPTLVIVSILAALAIMISWGRSHRETRDRRRLMRRINEDPQFEKPPPSDLDLELDLF